MHSQNLFVEYRVCMLIKVSSGVLFLYDYQSPVLNTPGSIKIRILSHVLLIHCFEKIIFEGFKAEIFAYII